VNAASCEESPQPTTVKETESDEVPQEEPQVEEVDEAAKS
jgi:hypothetical protein